jgi:hypothetical protein
MGVLKVKVADTYVPVGVGGGGAGNIIGTGVTNIVTLTQAAYDALTTPNATTLYIIVG